MKLALVLVLMMLALPARPAADLPDEAEGKKWSTREPRQGLAALTQKAQARRCQVEHFEGSARWTIDRTPSTKRTRR